EAEGSQGGFHARNVSVMIGTQHIHHPIETALHFVQMVGDIGREVGVVAVFTLHDAVLFVTEVRASEPARSVLQIYMPTLLESRDRSFDEAIVKERLLREPAV